MEFIKLSRIIHRECSIVSVANEGWKQESKRGKCALLFSISIN